MPGHTADPDQVQATGRGPIQSDGGPLVVCILMYPCGSWYIRPLLRQMSRPSLGPLTLSRALKTLGQASRARAADASA